MREIHIVQDCTDINPTGVITGIPEIIFEKFKDEGKIWFWDSVRKWICTEHTSDELYKILRK